MSVNARLPLAQVPHAPVHDRVRSFVADQQKRVGQYAAEGLAVARTDIAADAPLEPSRAPVRAQASPLLRARVPLAPCASVVDDERENIQPRPKEDRGSTRKAREREASRVSQAPLRQKYESDDAKERESRT